MGVRMLRRQSCLIINAATAPGEPVIAVKKSSTASRKHVPRLRSPLKPRRSPSLQDELNNDRIYEVLYALWTSEICVNGPDPATIVATVGFKPDNLLYEIYQIWPATDQKNKDLLKSLLQSIGDVMDFDGSRIVLRASILAALQPESGDLIWLGVAEKRCRFKDLGEGIKRLGVLLRRDVAFSGPVW